MDAKQAGQLDFSLPHDVVELPSKGIFYKTKKKSLKVGYLTANDENILANARKNGGQNIIQSLLRSKIYESEIKPEDLLTGDVEAILIFLRNTSFGPEYTFEVMDDDGKKFETTVTIDELNIRKSEFQPNEDGTFTTILPKTGHTVKLRPTTFGDNVELEKMEEAYPVGLVAPTVTWRLNKLIVEVNGDNSPETISSLIQNLPIMDSKYIRNFIDINEPKLDLSREVFTPSGKRKKVLVSFGVDFFRPFFS
jgi:hypothetical protein